MQAALTSRTALVSSRVVSARARGVQGGRAMPVHPPASAQGAWEPLASHQHQPPPPHWLGLPPHPGAPPSARWRPQNSPRRAKRAAARPDSPAARPDSPAAHPRPPAPPSPRPSQAAKPAGQTRAARAPVAVRAAAERANWLPGSDFPAHLENCKLPACYGFDPLGLGANPERLTWFAESERVHARWAMLGVAGILAQVRGARWRGAGRASGRRRDPRARSSAGRAPSHAAVCALWTPAAGDCAARCVLVHLWCHPGAAL